MAEVEKVLIELAGDNKGAQKAILETESSLEKMGKKGKSSLETLKSSWLAVTAAVTGYIAGLKGVLDAYAKQEQAELKLAAALKKNGENVNATMREYKALASEMQKVAGVADEQVLEMARLATTLGVSRKEMRGVIESAIGLSTALGIDYERAVRAVIAAHKGHAQELRRYIPDLRDTATATQALAIVQERAASGFKQAQQSMGGVSGATKHLSNVFSDFKEELGRVIGTMLLPLIKGLSKLLDIFLSLPEPVRNAAIAFGAVVTTITAAAGAVKALSSALAALGASSAINPAVLALGAVAAAATAIGIAAINARQKLEELWTASPKKTVFHTQEEIRKMSESELKEKIKYHKEQAKKQKEIFEEYYKALSKRGQELFQRLWAVEVELSAPNLTESEFERLQKKRQKLIEALLKSERKGGINLDRISVMMRARESQMGHEGTLSRLEAEMETREALPKTKSTSQTQTQTQSGKEEKKRDFRKEKIEEIEKESRFVRGLLEENAKHKFELLSKEEAAEYETRLRILDRQRAFLEENKNLSEEELEFKLFLIELEEKAAIESEKRKAEEKRKALENAINLTQGALSVFADLSSRTAEISEEGSKQAFEANKMAKAAETANTTISAAMKAYESVVGIPTVGPVLAPAAMAATLALGAVQVGKILSSTWKRPANLGGAGEVPAPSVSTAEEAGSLASATVRGMGPAPITVEINAKVIDEIAIKELTKEITRIQETIYARGEAY